MSATISYPPAIPWQNQDIQLFHGTLLRFAESVVSQVDLKFARAETDFGRGFYTTTNEAQARRFARVHSDQQMQQGAVVSITLPREEMARLTTIGFVLGDSGAEDFWSFVHFCRSGATGHGRKGATSFYDAVLGPVTRNWWKQRTLYPSFDQISFHTEEAMICLNKKDRRRMIWTCPPSKMR